MKNKVKIFLTAVCVLLSQLAFSQQKYIATYKEHAKALSDKYGIPTSVILAVAVIETGGGTSKNANTLNNHFGIVGPNTVNSSRYRSFSSVHESYEAFCKLVAKKSFFTKLKGTKDFTSWVSAIAGAGYSTQPGKWVSTLQTMYHKLGLQSVDF